MNKRSKMADDGISRDLIKSESDHREYRYVKLQNGIEAVLVQIPKEQSSKAAVAVSVGAGSMDEPDLFGGLAHFVEHCVFLGNSKFPNRNSLDKLLGKHNGYSNAHTELQYTAFYLEVNKEALSKAVEIFAAAFESPSFDCGMCCAELEAVDSEFHEVLNNDDCRIEQLLCHLSSPSHPYKKFTWGNRNSLLKPHGEESLVGAAKSFFETFYTPNRMKVSIVSSHSFAKMEALLNMFEAIAIRADLSPPSPLVGCAFPIPESALPISLVVKPVSDIHQLILLFQLPSIISHYRTKPVDYLAHILGHESEGSLIAVLREASLAVDIAAGVGSDGYSNNSGLSMFELKLNLTLLGLQHWQMVLTKYVFPYIELCKAQGIVASVYEEMAKVGSFQFNKTSEDSSKDPIDTAEALSILLLESSQIDAKHLLVSEYLFDEFQPTLIKDFFGCIDVKKAITLLVSGKAGIETWETEPIFGIHYAVLPPQLPEAESAVWEFVVPPNPNEFIPTTPTDKCLPVLGVHAKEELFVEPTKTVSTSKICMYICGRTRSVPTPKLDVRVQLNLDSKLAHRQTLVDQFVTAQVFVGCLTDLLEARLYSAKLVGYHVCISSTAPRNGRKCVGIEICVHGYFEKIFDLLNLVLSSLNSEHSWARFERVVEMMRRGFANEEIHPVTTQALNARRVAIAPLSFFRSIEKLEALDRVRLGGMRVEVCSADALLVGCEAERVAGLLLPVLESLVVDDGPPSTTPTSSATSSLITPIVGVNRIIEPAANPTELTGCLIIYYQLSPVFSLPIAAIADVLSDLMSEPFFDSLRTEEQLGYSVQCGSRSTNGSVGIEFMIQSSSGTPGEMVARVDRFVAKFFDREVAPMSKAEFNNQIHAFLEGLLEPPSSLAAEAKELWNEVNEGRLLWRFNADFKAEVERKFIDQKETVKALLKGHLRLENRIVVEINSLQLKPAVVATHSSLQMKHI